MKQSNLLRASLIFLFFFFMGKGEGVAAPMPPLDREYKGRLLSRAQFPFPVDSAIGSPPQEDSLRVKRKGAGYDRFLEKRPQSKEEMGVKGKRKTETSSKKENFQNISVSSDDEEQKEALATQSASGWRSASLPSFRGKKASQIYYHSSFLSTLPCDASSQKVHYQGPVVQEWAKKSWAVILSARFDEQHNPLGEAFCEEMPARVDEHVSVLQRYRDGLFPELAVLFQGLSLTELTLSHCQMESDHLEVFRSLGYLTSLDLSHNHLTIVPSLFSTWLHRYGKALRVVNLGHNPWEIMSLKQVRSALKKSLVHTLFLENVGMEGGWNELQGFLGKGTYPHLRSLNVRHNDFSSLKMSSFLKHLLERDYFSLAADHMKISVRHKHSKLSFREVPEIKDKEDIYNPPFLEMTHVKGTIDTLRVSSSLLLEEFLTKKLFPLKIAHLEILGVAQIPYLMSVFDLRNLQSLNIGDVDLTSFLIKEIGFAMRRHQSLSRLIVTKHSDLGWGLVEQLVEALRKPFMPSSYKQQRLLKRLQKKQGNLDSKLPLTDKEKQKQKRNEEKISQLTGVRPFTVILPSYLRSRQQEFEAFLDQDKTVPITLGFEESDIEEEI